MALTNGISPISPAVRLNRSIRSRNSIFSFTAGQNEVSRILRKTEQSKILQYLKRMSIFILPMATLIVMSAIGLEAAITTSFSSYQAEKTLTRDMAMATLVQEIQLERGLSTMRQVEDDGELHRRIIEQVVRVDQALKKITYWVEAKVNGRTVDSKAVLRDILNEKRVEAKMIKGRPAQVMHSYTEVTYGLLRVVNSHFQLLETGMIWRIMVAHLAIIQAMEHAGIERALGSIYFRECQLPQDDEILLSKSRAQSRILLQVSSTYHSRSSSLTHDLIPDSLIANLQAQSKLTRSKTFVEECMNMTDERRLEYMLSWFDNMTIYISALGQTRRNLSTEILDNVNRIVKDAKADAVAYSVGSIFAISLGILAGYWNAKGLTRITETIGYHANKLHENNAKLNDERCKTETLLHSMLPTFVAKKLKKGEQVNPRAYESATVYFSDLIGFDQTTTKLEPSYAVQLLNDVYTLFDGIIDKFEVYKVETVSDHYMVVSGLPEENGEQHAVEIANMALMMRKKFSKNWRMEHCMGADLQLRAGFHSGSVVAGVVGRKLPRYCLFGDTVNTASRMQSKSAGGEIQISESAAEILEKRCESFVVKERGMVEFKGKGQMRVYWLYAKEGTSSNGSVITSVD